MQANKFVAKLSENAGGGHFGPMSLQEVEAFTKDRTDVVAIIPLLPPSGSSKSCEALGVAKKPLYVFAESVQHAYDYASRKGMHVSQICYVSDYQRISGVSGVRFVKVGNFYNHPKWLDMEPRLKAMISCGAMTEVQP